MLARARPDNLTLKLENLLGFERVADRPVIETSLDALVRNFLAPF